MTFLNQQLHKDICLSGGYWVLTREGKQHISISHGMETQFSSHI